MSLARTGIEDLNEKYGPAASQTDDDAAGSSFFLFHRPRRWNPEERLWMGYERKRGKLAALNSYLRGGARDDFSLVVGDTAALSNVKYVITLDTDTQLPRDAARQFVGVMAHPLNRARFDAAGTHKGSGLVTEGYGILQPRVSVSLPGANRSWYVRLHGGDPGIDPYTRAVSDVYQDVFREGSFIGKGIYDVDAFERALDARFPENRILSHDLLEGCYARSGLLSDVQLFEEHPSTYGADISRRHRWIRGDWQLAGWLLPLVPGPGKRRLRNPLSALSLWKLFDNLRRSLVPAGLTLLLLLGWTVLPHAGLWTLTVIAILLLPSASAGILELLRKPDEVLLRQHLAATASAAGRHAAQTALTLAFLPYEAAVNLDAIARTAWRMLVAASAPARMESVGRRRAGSSPRRRHKQPLRTCNVGPDDVDRAGDRHGDGDPADADGPDRIGGSGADTPAVARFTGHRMVDQPPARAPRAAVDGGASAFPSHSRAKDVGILRRPSSVRMTMASARQLSGASGRQHRASHIADEHGPRAVGKLDRLRFRLHPGRTISPAHRECHEHDEVDGTARGAFLQLVRHTIAQAAAAPLYLGGGQRKSRGSSDDLAAGSPGACR